MDAGGVGFGGAVDCGVAGVCWVRRASGIGFEGDMVLGSTSVGRGRSLEVWFG